MLQEIVADDLNILIYLNYLFRDRVFFLLHLHDTVAPCSPVLASSSCLLIKFAAELSAPSLSSIYRATIKA